MYVYLDTTHKQPAALQCGVTTRLDPALRKTIHVFVHNHKCVEIILYPFKKISIVINTAAYIVSKQARCFSLGTSATYRIARFGNFP